jgi:hypothetical protein
MATSPTIASVPPPFVRTRKYGLQTPPRAVKTRTTSLQTPPRAAQRSRVVKLITPPRFPPRNRSFVPHSPPSGSVPPISPKRKRPRTGQTHRIPAATRKNVALCTGQPEFTNQSSFGDDNAWTADGDFTSGENGGDNWDNGNGDDDWDLIRKREQLESLQKVSLPLYLECFSIAPAALARLTERLFIIQDWNSKNRTLQVFNWLFF